MVERRIETLLTAYMPFPMCIIDNKGKVTRANSKIDEVFIYDRIKDVDFYALTGIKHSELKSTGTGKGLFLQRNKRTFRIMTKLISDNEDASTLVYFHDVTNYEYLKTLYKNKKVCMAIVSVDNFDELSSNTAEDKRSALITRIDQTIRQWAAKMNASVTRYKDYMYMILLERSSYEKLAESKFSILDEVREIETETDFPITLSIGIGIGGKNLAQTEQFAHASLELALGRGGDQAVIRRGSAIDYYGGKAQAVEKSNKGKSRIIAHAIKQLMDQSSKVLIMGHRNPDMDSFGSALGIFRLAANAGREAHIVISKYRENIAEIYKQASETEMYSFITGEKAVSIANEECLLVIVDTNRACIAECPELLDFTDKVVIIDHHRKAEDSIENATLSYTEPYASSTAELVTEILQYARDKRSLNKFEAEALLAGITVDTNRFAGKTGVRTFEAASWLRRAGADTSAVVRFFQTDEKVFKMRARSVAEAEFLNCGIALTICEGEHSEIQVINSQAADILLEIKGIKASFVAGIDSDGITCVSARSLGEVNVQVIMEEFGGGGHLMTAGAQVNIPPEEVIKRIKSKFLEETYKWS